VNRPVGISRNGRKKHPRSERFEPALNSEFPDRRTRRPAWAIGMRSIEPVLTNSRAVRGAHVRHVQSSVMQTNFDVNDRHIATTLRCRRRFVIVVPSCRPVTRSDILHWYYVFDRHLWTFVPVCSGASQYQSKALATHSSCYDRSTTAGGRP
jgi:hypothetical protein